MARIPLLPLALLALATPALSAPPAAAASVDWSPWVGPVGDAALREACLPSQRAAVIGSDFLFTRWAPQERRP